ncbi:hypothetical protein H9P43_005378 [Blastocladiella emersonii ATCC 22665]|nr:hypothetical protein H9P43_005378 [Blastocladiella emersonii ATCC 22665]
MVTHASGRTSAAPTAITEERLVLLQRLVEHLIPDDPVKRARGFAQANRTLQRTWAFGINETTIWNQLEGIETKLRLWGYVEAADYLRSLINKLVAPPSSSLLDHERTMYAVLDVILNTARSLEPSVFNPIVARAKRDRERTEPPDPRAVELDELRRELARDAPSPVKYDYDAASRTSDWASDSDGEPDAASPDNTARPGELPRRKLGDLVEEPNGSDPTAWLAYLAAVQYWHRRPAPHPPVSFALEDPHSLALSLAFRPTDDDPVAESLPFNPILVTEAEVARESLWLLRGLPCALYAEDTTTHAIRVVKRVSVTHLAQDTLLALMTRFALRAARINVLRRLAAELRHHADPVLVALAAGTAAELDLFDLHLADLERNLQHHYIWQPAAAPPRKASLLSLLQATATPFLDELESVAGAWTASTPGTAVVDAVHEHVVARQLTPTAANWLRLFLGAARAVCTQVDAWLRDGRVVSPSFFVRRALPDGAGAAATEEDTWRAGFLVDDAKVPRLLRGVQAELVVLGKSTVMATLADARRPVPTAACPPFYTVFADYLHAHCADPSRITREQWAAAASPWTSDDLQLSRPLDRVLADAVRAALGAFTATSIDVVHSFAVAHGLHRHMRALSGVYLMEDGATWADVCRGIFRRVRVRAEWCTVDRLAGLLLEPLADVVRRSGVEGEVLALEIVGAPAIRSVHIQYLAPWPVRALVGDEQVGGYNCVMVALLYLRQAKYLLEGDGALARIRRVRSREFDAILALRLRLLHFVRAIEAFWMVTVIETERIRFRAELDRATAIDSLIAAHQQFLGRVLDKSLLNTPPLADAIGQVFGLCSQFAGVFDHLLWPQAADVRLTARTVEVRRELVAKLESIRDTFDSLSSFLVRSLEVLTTRGNIAHFESLLFALQRPEATSRDV